MRMRPSRVLRKLRHGEPASCVKLNTCDPRVVEIACASSGFDCVWLDNEHTPTDWLIIENMIRAAKIYDVDTVVRVSKGSYSDYLRPFEADAAGIMVPHLMSAAEAKQIVRTTRFHPVGRRPVDGGNVDGAFCRIDFREYLQQANKERFVIVQLEDPEPFQELDEIASVPGFDMLFFGPGDFSHGIGKAGQWDAPEIAAARRAVAEAARRHGKFAGTVCGPDTIGAMRDEGFQFLSIGADVVGLLAYFDGLARAFKQAESKP